MPRDTFTTIRTEGGILPADLLQRIAAGDKTLDGLTPDACHLSPAETLNEAASRAWNRLLAAWQNLRAVVEKLPPGDPGATAVRERWLLPLFSELGYGRLRPAAAVEIDARSYPVSHSWGHLPIHLVGWNVPLDRPQRVAGGLKSSPHGLVQELLNRSEASLWGVVSNGRRLRILRDNRALTRQSFVDFDVEAMMEGEVYADFALLFLLLHQSRVEAERAQECWLEKWSQAAQEQGTRALDRLRIGVEAAITALGCGFLAHPANAALRERLRSGELTGIDYYRQLLRMVYRLLFLFVAEDRDLLLVSAASHGPATLSPLGSGASAAPGGSELPPSEADPAADYAARLRYTVYYSATRLRRMAERLRGSRHADLYETLKLVIGKLASEQGCQELSLPALGSFLFSGAAAADLDQCALANTDLLEAVRALAFTHVAGMRRQVDYRNLRSEELGSVYEALLELHPEVNVDAPSFCLGPAAGSERKTTGSYYTPDSLVQCLLDTALDPVLAEAAAKPDPEQALLDLTVCDPACGSGHFLIAAAHRIARRLASVRTGEEEPSPEGVRHALRQVIGRCLYGVDVNPMAVELCKVALWIEALEPGRPLSFLDHHIKSGNSLLGATPALLAAGIPDAAFEPIGGDDNNVCRDLKKRNRSQREGQEEIDYSEERPWERLGDFASGMARLATRPDATLQEVRKKEAAFAELMRSAHYQDGRLWADAWCAAFVWPKREDDALPYAMTERYFRRIEQQGAYGIDPWMRDEVRRLARQYGFFHWHLEFPEVFPPASHPQPTTPVGAANYALAPHAPAGAILLRAQASAGEPPLPERAPGKPASGASVSDGRERRGKRAGGSGKTTVAREQPASPGVSGGFDAVLGNPPWERITLSEKEWFAPRRPEVAAAANAAARGRLIAALATEDPPLYHAWFAALRQAAGWSHLIRNTGRYPLCGRGDVNTYAIFAELFRKVLSPRGRAGVIVPTGIATDDNTKLFMQDVVNGRSLVSLYSFENEEHLFPAVHHAVKFCLLALTGLDCATTAVDLIFFARQVSALADQNRRFELTAEDFALLNPNTRTCPIFRTRRDAEITKEIYRRVPVLIREEPELNPWGLSFLRMFDMSGDSEIFHQSPAPDRLPLYEAKMMHQFDHRFGDYADKPEDAGGTALPDVPSARLRDPNYRVTPRYWVDAAAVEARLVNKDRAWLSGWLLGWRDITNATNERTVIASFLPRVGIGHTVPLFLPECESTTPLAFLAANLGSFGLDYATRQKLGGTHLTYHVLEQLPVLPPETYDSLTPWQPLRTLQQFLGQRVLELIYTAWEMQPFAQDCGFDGPPFVWDDERRLLMRCELDAAYFHLYGIDRDDADYILETFPIVRREDEAHFGEFRTKRVVLEIYDAMSLATESGLPYQTVLDPPPANGWEPEEGGVGP